MSAALRTPPFHRRLHVRIGVVVLAVFALTALSLLLLSRFQQQRVEMEVTQRLNLGLARYIVEHQPGPLLDVNGAPERGLLMKMAMDAMMINPALEVYVLDSKGAIVGHALDGANVRANAVDLRPVRELLGDLAHVELPVLGDDPSTPGARNVFSTTMIGDATGRAQGYLYIVLRGKASQGLAEASSRSRVMRETTAAVLLACGVAGLALLAAMVVLTRPLRRLTAEVQAYRGSTPARTEARRGPDEIALLESAMQGLQARVNEQFRHMEGSDRARRELVANLSHDLQTPLAIVQGYAEHCLLKNDTMPAATRARTLQLMLRHCAGLAKRISDLFDLSRLDAGRIEPKLEVFCLAELLQDVIDGYQLKARAGQVRLVLGARSRSDACVRADIALMERVFQNLIDNALRHTPIGGAVCIDITPGAEDLQISVSDTGAGIAKEHLAHVFERYYQAQDPGTIACGPSAGLGLAIVKRILELHGSAIRVSSEIAKGTCFDFRLPRVA